MCLLSLQHQRQARGLSRRQCCQHQITCAACTALAAGRLHLITHCNEPYLSDHAELSWVPWPPFCSLLSWHGVTTGHPDWQCAAPPFCHCATTKPENRAPHANGSKYHK